MNYLHTMVRVFNLEESLDFYCKKLGLIEVKRTENEQGRFTLIFLAAPSDLKQVELTRGPMLELTYNWDSQPYWLTVGGVLVARSKRQCLCGTEGINNYADAY